MSCRTTPMALKNPFRRTEKEKSTMENETVKNEGATTEQPERPTPHATSTDNADTPSAGEQSELETLRAELDLLRAEHAAIHDKHIRLFAEFDNFRKRTTKERLDLLQFAGENTLKAVLPALDDMDRAVANNDQVEDVEAVREGMRLIHQKMQHVLASQGLKMMPDSKGEPFDTDRHEAITKAPAPSNDLKGKVLDVVENGYTLHDKVIRYAKVVVGE
jgi:molecular chaperone GrpE